MPRPLRVAFLCTAYPAGQESRGIFHQNLAEALVRQGAAVEVIAPVARVPPGLAGLRSRWKRYRRTPLFYAGGGVRVHRPRYLQWPRGDFLASPHRAFARLALKSLADPPDVFHAHFSYPCGLAALEVSKRWKVPTVLTLHGSDVNLYPLAGPRARRRFRQAVNGASTVVAVSEALAERTRELTGRSAQVMPIGIDLRAYETSQEKETAREMLGLPANRPIVLYVGALVATKGVTELLRALSALSEQNALGCFVGDGPLMRQVIDCPGALAVGHQAPERVRLYMSAADLFVLPSYSEGMPTTLIEAGASGLPVVATAVGGIPELLSENRGLLIPPRNVLAIVEAVRTVLADPVAARQRAETLHQHVRCRYDVDRNAGKLHALYESLL